MNKCEICEYSNIDHIILYDVIVDVCSKCDIIRVTYDDYIKIIKSYLYSENFANIKKCFFNGEFSKKDIKLINDFIEKMSLYNFKFIKNYEGVHCNFCKDELCRLWNNDYKKFTIYYCVYCNSVYFNKNDLNEALNYFKKYIVNKNKWYGFFYKFLEIFQ